MGAKSGKSSPPPALGVQLIMLLFVTLPTSDVLAQPVGLGPDFPVGADDPPTFDDVQRTRAVSRASDGTFVVVWEKGAAGASRQGVFAQLYDAVATPIGTEFRVSGESQDTGDLSSKLPAVDHTANGEFVVVWAGLPQDESATYQQVLGKRLDRDGNPIGTEFQAGTATPRFGSGPDVRSIGDGRFVVVWEGRVDLASYAYQVVGQRFAADATKLGTAFVANTFTEGDVFEAQVGSRGDGSFVVVWSAAPYQSGPSPDGGEAGVFGQRFGSDGSPVGTEFQVNTFTPYSQQDPDITVKPDGGFVVVWTTPYGDEFPNPAEGPPLLSDDSITMRRYDASGDPTGDEEHINTYLPGNQRKPAIAMDDDGKFVVVWESRSAYYSGSQDNRDDAEGGLFGRCFDAAGVGAAEEFHVNTYTTGREQDVSIATSGTGAGFVVVWDQGEGYGGGGDLRGRRFALQSCPTSGGPTTTSTTLPDGGTCGDPVDSLVASAVAQSPRLITASDALFVLRTAVGSATCELCVCDVDSSGAVTASDALATLKSAVGQGVALTCPACTV
jgi:hypothetical protein